MNTILQLMERIESFILTTENSPITFPEFSGTLYPALSKRGQSLYRARYHTHARLRSTERLVERMELVQMCKILETMIEAEATMIVASMRNLRMDEILSSPPKITAGYTVIMT